MQNTTICAQLVCRTLLLAPADPDQCALKTAQCSPNAICQKLVGSYTCVCKDGFAPPTCSICLGGYAFINQTCVRCSAGSWSRGGSVPGCRPCAIGTTTMLPAASDASQCSSEWLSFGCLVQLPKGLFSNEVTILGLNCHLKWIFC